MSTFKAIFQNNMSYQLVPLPIRELFHLSKLPSDVYGIVDGLFQLIFEKGTKVDKEIIMSLISAGHRQVFIYERDFVTLVEIQQDNLRNVSRSLSIGNPIDKCRKFFSLLSINLRYLYDDPTNDEILNLQLSSLVNFSKLLYKNSNLQIALFEEILKQKHHFTQSQPLLSSIFLLGILRQSKQFSERECEQLFIASYFKDIGMAAIPRELYDREKLTLKEEALFKKHPEESVKLLEGRIGLSRDKLGIIKNHHMFSQLDKRNSRHKGNKDVDVMMYGFETMLVNMTDIIAAMITGRPYQPATSLFDALQLVRSAIGDQYPQEFKLFVTYFKNFFDQMK
jgi:HD-GYP domain-containing protein (c-di-GMP phosphodiesterase class II)